MNAVKLLLMFDILMASVTPLLGKWKALSEKKKPENHNATTESFSF